MSPDGQMLAVVAYSTQLNNYGLWTYEVGSRRSNSLEGTQGASYPFWSPDGKTIGFFADGKLKKVAVTGGQAQVLCDAPNGRGGAWNRDGVIVLAPNALGGLFRVPALGGSPVPITTLDTSRYESSHRWPVFLPDGKHFLYLAANFTGRYAFNTIVLGALESTEKRSVVSSSANVAYAEPGFLIYLHDQSLVAQRFDTRNYVVSGEPHILSDGVMFFPQVNRAVFSASTGQVLVTQTGKGASVSQLIWFDRNGKPLGNIGAPGSHDNVRLSPDGRRLATDQIDPDGRNIDIWIYEPAHNVSTRLTFDPSLDQTPIWSPDGKKILFTSNRTIGESRAFEFHLYLKNSDGSGSDEEMGNVGAVTSNAWDWSRDGQYALFKKDTELWYLSLRDRVTKPLFQGGSAIQNAQFSPDGRWIAYASNETGSMEVYVSPFPRGPGKWQVSTSGGGEPRWRADGKELFYLSVDGKIMAVPVSTGTGFAAGSPTALFQTHRRQPVSAQDFFSYDVSADGQKFVVATKLDEGSAAPLSVLLNWASEMEK